MLPGIYNSYFSNISDIHHYHTCSRTNQNLFILRPRTNQYRKFSVRCAAAEFWNKIPLNTKKAASLQNFRKDLKEYLLSLKPESDFLTSWIVIYFIYLLFFLLLFHYLFVYFTYLCLLISLYTRQLRLICLVKDLCPVV